MQKITISTKKPKQVIDITEKIEDILSSHQDASLCNIFLMHTTAALTVADMDPGADLDMLNAFDKIVPKLKYCHPHNPAHMPDHILSAIIGTSLTLPIQNGKLVLGTWQRVVF